MTSAIEGQIEFEHYHRYCLARDFCIGLDVLDVAAGEGYGSAILASTARSVVGVEIDAAAAAHAAAAYDRPNLRFLQGDALALPLENASVDVITSFETLEHLSDQGQFLSEVRRVLRPEGLFIVSTPDRSVYSAYGTDPNPYHVLELTEPEFRALLEAHFGHVRLAEQRPVLGSILAVEDGSPWRSYERRDAETIEASNGLARAHYLVAFATDGALPALPSSAYIDRRRVHDVVQQALQHPILQSQADTYVRERDAARAEADHQGMAAEVAQSQIETLRIDREASRMEAVRLHGEAEVLSHERDALRAETARLSSEAEALADECKASRAEVALQRRRTEVAQHQADILARERDEARADATRLQEDVTIHSQQGENLLRERDEARADVTRLYGDLAIRQRQEEALVQERDQARAETVHLSAEVAQLGQRSRRAFRGETSRQAILAPFAALAKQKAVRRAAQSRARLVRRLTKSPLFDSEWYRTVSGLTQGSREKLVAHYIEIGEAGNLSPHPLFSPSFYLRQIPEANVGLANALDHYIEIGSRSGLHPHPLFDPEYYRAANAGVPEGVEPVEHYLREGRQRLFRTHPLFDGAFYLAANPDVARDGQDALLHYLRQGWQEERQPHPLFDTAYYLRENSDVASNQLEPLAHYISYGSDEGRQPHPLFDTDAYKRRYPDVAQAGVEPIIHFVTSGWREQRQPHPLFDTRFYFDRYPDAENADVDPLTDFLSDRTKFGRITHALFDPSHYCDQYRDVVEAGSNPLRHFLDTGWREGRSPHPLFDATYYLSHSPDTHALNPLLHYVEFGWREGRKPHVLFDPSYYTERHHDVLEAEAEPLADFLTVGDRLGRDPHPLFDVAAYRSAAGLAVTGAENSLLHYIRVGAKQAIPPHPLFHAAGYAMDQRDISHFDGNALVHYLAEGASAFARPHPLFDPVLYARTYADVSESRLTPFEHYVRFGLKERRLCSELLKVDKTLLDVVLRLPPADEESVRIIIPVYKNYGDTYRCLFSIAATADACETARVVLADDCPAHPIGPLFENVDNLEIIAHPENLGFLRSCNRAASLTGGAFVVFLNNDTIVRPNWLVSLVAPVRRDPLVAMVGCKLLNADGTVQEAGGIMFKDGWGYPYGRNDDPTKPEYNFVRQVDCVIGACFLVRRKHFEEVGGLDDRYYPAFFEEFDLAMAFTDRGYRVLYQPASEVVHIGSSSYGAEMRDRQSMINHDRFVQKWERQLAQQFDGPNDVFLARDRQFASGVILVIDDMVPEYDKHAGALTLFQYLKLFVRLGFKVIYLPADLHLRQPYTSTLQQEGIEVLYGEIDVATWMRTNGSLLDYVWIARPEVARQRLDEVLTLTMARVLYYTHDLHFLREKRRYELDGNLLAKQESERLLPIETHIFNRVDCVLTPSADEVPIISDLAPSVAVQVLTPYFFDGPPASTAKNVPVEKRREIVFVGGYAHTPNVDAAILLVRNIMPLVWRSVPDAKLLLIGSNPPSEVRALAGPRVDVVGFVPDLAPWYARARMSVSPLRWGAGVKGKIVESLLAGVPVVTTPIGNEGIALEHGRQVLVGTTEREIAEHVITLFQDQTLLETLAVAGPKVIVERFSERAARTQFLEAASLVICNICGNRYARKETAPIDLQAQRNWREEPSCPACLALNRMNAVADSVLRPYRAFACTSVMEALPYMRDTRVHEFGFDGALRDQLKSLPHFSCSDYFHHLPTGTATFDGEVNEGFSCPSFGEESFDLSISMNVMNRVPEPVAAFREIFRALSPGGRHIMTVPYNPHVDYSATRCEIIDGDLVHHLPPVYHGSSTQSDGALIFTDYGRDLIDTLKNVGFTVGVEETHRYGTPGGYIAVFECIRPSNPSQTRKGAV